MDLCSRGSKIRKTGNIDIWASSVLSLSLFEPQYLRICLWTLQIKYAFASPFISTWQRYMQNGSPWVDHIIHWKSETLIANSWILNDNGQIVLFPTPILLLSNFQLLQSFEILSDLDSIWHPPDNHLTDTRLTPDTRYQISGIRNQTQDWHHIPESDIRHQTDTDNHLTDSPDTRARYQTSDIKH